MSDKASSSWEIPHHLDFFVLFMPMMLQSLMCGGMNCYETTKAKLLGRPVHCKYRLSEAADLWCYIHHTFTCIVVSYVMGVHVSVLVCFQVWNTLWFYWKSIQIFYTFQPHRASEQCLCMFALFFFTAFWSGVLHCVRFSFEIVLVWVATNF